MAYKEPGAYVSYNNTTAKTTGNVPPLLPCIIGSGAKFMKTTIQVIRDDANQKDILPYWASGIDNCSIIKIGQTSTSHDYYDAAQIKETDGYKKIEAHNTALDPETDTAKMVELPKPDYTVSVESNGFISITWDSADLTYTDVTGTNLKNGYTEVTVDSDVFEVRKTRKPDSNFVYYVELIYPVNPKNRPNQFEVNLISSENDIYSTYGELMSYADAKGETKEVNKLSLGLYLCWLNGAASQYGLQINYDSSLKPNGPDQYDYSSALTKIQVIDSVYRLVPLDLNNSITDVILNHVVTMSSPEEKMERRAFVSYAPSTEINNFSQFSTALGGFAESIKNGRIGLVCKYNASISLPDGSALDPIDVAGSEPFICCALAGLETSLPLHRSLTKQTIVGFKTVTDVMPLLRTQKNILASKGIILLEQTGGNNNLLTTVRHALTTNMESVQSRENSIISIADYTGKMVRAALAQYIGKENVTTEVLTRMEASANSVLDNLIQNNVLIDGAVTEITQDTDQPDTVYCSVAILPPYPCNYINIDIVTQ